MRADERGGVVATVYLHVCDEESIQVSAVSAAQWLRASLANLSAHTEDVADGTQVHGEQASMSDFICLRDNNFCQRWCHCARVCVSHMQCLILFVCAMHPTTSVNAGATVHGCVYRTCSNVLSWQRNDGQMHAHDAMSIAFDKMKQWMECNAILQDAGTHLCMDLLCGAMVRIKKKTRGFAQR
jgi:hypothetical protein